MNKSEIIRRSEILKTISHPDRLCIIRGLNTYKCNVGQMQSKLGLSQSGLSQHLAKLKAFGIIRGERKGKEICYKVVDDLAMKIVEIIFRDMIDD